MEEQIMRHDDCVIIQHREAADTLIDPKKYRYLEPFLRRERSLGEASKVSGVATNLMHYHVKRMLRLGLIKEVGERQGRGRKSKLYRVSAERFFIPLRYTSLETMEAVLYQLQEPLLREMIRSRVRWAAQEHEDLGMGFELTEGGFFDLYLRTAKDNSWHSPERIKADDFPAMFSKFLVNIPFDSTTAKAIQRELIDLFEKYVGQSQAKGKRYHLHLSIVPVAES